MNICYRNHCALLILALLIAVYPATAQSDFWEQCRGPEGASISDMTLAPDGTIYAIGSGTYRSIDDGVTWAKVSELVGNRIVCNRDGVLFAAWTTNFYRSTNGGSDWEHISEVGFYGTDFGAGDEGAIECIASNTGSMYAIDNYNTFRLLNGSWKTLSHPPGAYPELHSLGADSLGNVFIGTRWGLFMMNDTVNAKWIELKHYGVITTVAYSSAGYWFCTERATYNDSTLRIYRTRSLDSLNTPWDTVFQAKQTNPYVSIHSFRIAPSGEIIAFANTVGLLRSTDNGDTWTIDTTSQMSDVLFTDDGREILGRNGGVGPVRSTDNGYSWQLSNSGMNSLPVEDVAVSPSGVLYSATIGQGIYRSTEGGNSWEPIYSGSVYESMISLAITNRGTLLASDAWHIYRSSDDGTSWEQVYSDIGSYIQLMTTWSGVVYGYPDSRRIIRSVDDGKSWEVLENSPKGWGTKWTHPVEDSTGRIWRFDWNGFMRTTDRWETWDTMAVPYPEAGYQIYSMAVQPSGAIVAAVDTGIIRSTNSGMTWEVISDEHPGGKSSSRMISVGDDNLIVADSSRNLYLSTNSGGSWSPIPVPAPHWSLVNAIVSDTSGYIYVATNKGLYRSKNRQVLSAVPDVSDNTEGLRVELRDGQLVLRPNVELSGSARLIITSVDGRQVAAYSLNIQEMQSGVSVPLPHLPVGTYICSVQSRSRQLRAKFVVLD